MEQLIASLAVKFPFILSVVAAIGAFRVVFKPIVSGIKGVVAATETKADDEAVAKVESSAIYKGLVWLVDLLTSIKLPVSK